MDRLDFRLLSLCLLMVGLGLAFMYGSSAKIAWVLHGDRGYFFYRQLWYSLVALVVMLLVSRMDVAYFFSLANVLLVVTILGLILVLFPGIGIEKKGARRWIGLDFLDFNFQPSEFVKMTLLIYLSRQLNKKDLNRLKEVLPLFIVVGVIFLLIFVEEDFSTATVCLLSALSLIFVAGVRLRYLVYLFLMGLPMVYFLITSFGHMKDRLIGYLSKFFLDGQAGYQERQANKMIGEAGYIGKGLGVGSFYGRVPESHTDFYFVSVVSDIGLVGGILVLCLMGYMYLRCIRVGNRLKKREYRYLVYGISFSLIWQSILNLGSVFGLLPIAGLPLPFLSYGGNALLGASFGMGLILSLSKEI